MICEWGLNLERSPASANCGFEHRIDVRRAATLGNAAVLILIHGRKQQRYVGEPLQASPVVAHAVAHQIHELVGSPNVGMGVLPMRVDERRW